MATPAMSNRAESTDTARLAHGRVRKKSRRKVPPPREEGGVCVSTMPAQSTGRFGRCKPPSAVLFGRSVFDAHRGRGVHVDIADDSADEGDVGGRPVVDGDLYAAAGTGPAAHRDAQP